MIKMQVRTIHQARCPYCGKVSTVSQKDAEVYCMCDEKNSYTNQAMGEDQ